VLGFDDSLFYSAFVMQIEAESWSMGKLGRLLGMLLIVAVVGCASAPVQEMSDARQALRAAQESGAGETVPGKMEQAEDLMQQAESDLESGDYRDARKKAQTVRELSIEARQKAVGGSN